MIDAWTAPAFVAVLLGGLGFVVLFVPILVWESRRHGQIRPNRMVGAAMVSIFAVAVVAYTLLPLPDAAWCAANRQPGINLDATQVVRVNLRYLRRHGTGGLLRSFDFLQAVFNIILFIPWGAFARRYFGLRPLPAIASGFIASVVIEALQGTAFFGLASCVYRVADIDDVLLNTLGAAIGVLFAPLLLFFVTDARVSEQTRERPRPVNRRRRLVAMLIDGFVFVTLPGILIVTWRLGLLYVLGRPLPAEDPGGEAIALGITLVVLLVPTLVGSGASVGQRAMWLRPEGDDLRRRVVRCLCGIGGWMLLGVAGSLPVVPDGVQSTAATLGSVWAVSAVVAVLADRSARGLSFRASGSGIADAREQSLRG